MGCNRYINPQCLFSVKGLLLIICSACAAAGLYFVVESTQDRRETEVEVYDNLAQAWTANGRGEFEGLTVTANNGSSTLSLLADSTADPLTGITNDLVTYSPLKYSHAGPVFGRLAWNATAGEHRVNLSVTIRDVASVDHTIVLPVTVYKTVYHPQSNQKNCRYQIHGSWRNRGCETYHVVQQVCLQVKSTSSGWELSSDPGCHPTNSWDVAQYTTVLGTNQQFGHGDPPEGDLSGLESVEVLVRSSKDPYIYAMASTNDTGDFGTPSRQELLVGLVIILAGLVLSIPLLLHIYTVYNERRSYLISEVDHPSLINDGQAFELNKLHGDNL